jgi:protein O-GlcNAc transferase
MTIAELLSSFSTARQNNDSRAAAESLAKALEIHEATQAPVPRTAYFDLAVLLVSLKRFPEAEGWARRGLKKRPKEFGLHNVLGVALRSQGRFAEALASFETAIKLDPKNVGSLGNAGNVCLDMGQGARAAEYFAKVVRLQPRSAELNRLLGVAYRQSGDFEKAKRQAEIARQLEPTQVSHWIDLAGLHDETGQKEQAIEIIARAIEKFGLRPSLLEARTKLYRRAGEHQQAIAWLESVIASTPPAAHQYRELARTLLEIDRRRANDEFRKALELTPDDPGLIMDLADSLDRTRGPDEPKNIAEAYDLCLRRLALGGNMMGDAKSLRNILIRCGDYDAAERIGGFEELGSYWANRGDEAALHYMMGQVRTPAQRRSLLAYHRMWGERTEKVAAQSPLVRAPAVTGRAKIRVGFMSSDLRNHPVAYFAEHLLTHYDRSRFEFYAYSWSTAETDPVEQRIAKALDAFRKVPRIGNRDAAQLIANDTLDILFELGGSTHMNKLHVMAWRPAPRQASWLGYPHSCGLVAVDRILVDPFIMPSDPALLIEKPFMLKRSWVALERPGFGPLPEVDPVTPEVKVKKVTFGTMNNPYKYNQTLIATWAEIVRKVPGSRFVFVRPEGGVEAFRENIGRAFESHGVSRDRIHYVGVRGAHLPYYNGIDITLDTFPQTGGTTTCEALWMGAPTITLVGEAFYERLTYSNLNNAGLGELCAFSHDDYVAKAVDLAGRTEWRSELRATMRERLRSHPIGQPDRFVEDFQDALTAWMDEGPV